MFRSLSLDICLRSICNISRYIVDVTELVRFKVILYFFSFVFACCHHHLHYREKHNFSNTVSECTKTVRFQCEKVTCFQHHLSLKTKTLSLSFTFPLDRPFYSVTFLCKVMGLYYYLWLFVSICVFKLNLVHVAILGRSNIN